MGTRCASAGAVALAAMHRAAIYIAHGHATHRAGVPGAARPRGRAPARLRRRPGGARAVRRHGAARRGHAVRDPRPARGGRLRRGLGRGGRRRAAAPVLPAHPGGPRRPDRRDRAAGRAGPARRPAARRRGPPGDRLMGPGVDPAFVRSVGRWLRAYPRRWRVARGAEVTAVLADLAPAGARRLDLRSGLGLLVAGWATRWREHPPLLAYLGYVGLELRLDPRYRDWARDDIEGPWFAVRRWLVTFAVVGVIAWLPALGGDALSFDSSTFFRAWAPTMLLGIAIWGGHWRARMVARQLVVHPGETVTPSGRIPGRVARPRVEARSWLAAARVVAVSVLVLCGVALAIAPNRTDAVLDGVGFQVTSAPMTTGTRAAGIGLAALGGGALLALVVPGFAALLAGPVAALAAAALPVLAAARRVVAAGGTGAVAGVDVVRALRRQPDRADLPVDGYLPAADWLPVGTVVPLPGDPAPPAPAPGTAVERRG